MSGIRFNSRGLDNLQKKISKVANTQHVPFDDLFPSSFMRLHTQFKSIDDLFAASGFKYETQEDFKAIPDAELDVFITQTTSFKTWEEMLTKATQEYMQKQLGF